MLVLNELAVNPVEAFGPWKDESETENALICFLDSVKEFSVHRQIDGHMLFAHHFQKWHSLRCDVLLIPTHNSKWCGGAIIIEIKKPGERWGTACSQLLDYMNSVWESSKNGLQIVPSFGFVFQVQKQHGPLASIMAQQHIGTAEFSYVDGSWPSTEAGYCLRFCCGEKIVLRIYKTGEIEVMDTQFGRKSGSRC